MKRLCAGLVACMAAVAVPAEAAEITRIASSFEPDDPFGLYLSAAYVRDQRKAKIVREHHQDGKLEEVSELRWLQVENRLDLDLRIGLWVDLEFRYTLPIIFSRDQRWDWAGVGEQRTDERNSTIHNNCVQADGQQFDPTCAETGAGRTPMFGVPSESFRGGLGNMRFGLAYALFNEKKDPSKPMWILGADYEAPTADLNDPSVLTTREARGGIGDRHHRYTFYTSFSKRLGVADPYFRIHYTLPWRGPGWYSNCDNPNTGTMAIPDNCGRGFWTRSETGVVAPHSGGFLFGSEFVPWESGPHQKIAIDLRVVTNYVGPGRYYNPMSDVFGKLHQTSDYLEVGGGAGISAWAAQYLGFSAHGTLLYATEHTLTGELIGEDITGPAGVPDGLVSLDRPEELNPNFDHRADMPSRRFRAQEMFNWRIDVKATLNF